MRLGVMGSSEGNGHPFSFSAILNGYDSGRLRAAGWGPIADYLDVRDAADFGIADVAVTHAWCPEPDETRSLCEATHIPNGVAAPEDMLGEVDGILLARDDWETHWPMASRLLAEDGPPLFIDKPLTLDLDELEAFRPDLEAGRVISCSGYRFAPELDRTRSELAVESLVTLRAVGPREWERYAVHLIEPLLLLAGARPVRVVPLRADHDAVVIELDGGPPLAVHCLGARAPGFVVDVVTARETRSIALADRFTAFRRLLGAFARMIDQSEPSIPPAATATIVRVLAAGREALRTGEPVSVEG